MPVKLPSSESSAMAEDVVRIAVTNAVSILGSTPQTQNHLMQLNKKSRLRDVVEELCAHWRLENVEDYALTFEDTKEYVTEKRKGDIINGMVLKLCQSPKKLIMDLLNILETKDDPQMRLSSYQGLHKLCSDYALAEELVKARGLEMIVKTVCEGNVSAQALAHLIATFNEIMKHDDLVSWEDERIIEPFIEQVASVIETEKSIRPISRDAKTQQCCLSILESLVNVPCHFESAEKHISVSSLLILLQEDNADVQLYALTLFNALFRLESREKKRKMKQLLEERQVRRIITEWVNKKRISGEMLHQLYVLQTLLLNLLEERMHTKVESQDQKALEKIKELRKLAFDENEPQAHRTRFSESYKKLGFVNDRDPTLDLRVTPPGMLALDMMYAFSCHHTDQYTKLVLENSCRGDGHECPFAQTSIDVVKLICEIIRIGEPPSDSGGTFFPMFFAHENPLEELFAITIQHVNKTWREMRATVEDFRKVMDVAKEQITSALKTSPPTMEDYKAALKTYNEISEGRKEEAKNRGEREGKAIQHLREMIKPEIKNLIQRQRMNFLCAGTRFNKYKRDGGGKERNKFVFCRLSANHKTLHYGEGSEETMKSADQLAHKLPIAEIKDFLTGPACQQIRDHGKRYREREGQLAFSLLKENGDTVDFIAPDQKVFDYWCDGINALLRRAMTSGKAKEELEMFLSMEVKIRLLDVEGIDIPDDPPPIPPMPENFNFCQEV